MQEGRRPAAVQEDLGRRAEGVAADEPGAVGRGVRVEGQRGRNSAGLQGTHR